jgi:hypothetical protein
VKDQAEFMVEDTKLELASAILNTRKELEDKKAQLADAKTEYPLDIYRVINLMVEVEEYEDGLKKLQSLQKELGL